MSEEEKCLCKVCRDCYSIMRKWEPGIHPKTQEEKKRVRCVQCRKWEWV